MIDKKPFEGDKRIELQLIDISQGQSNRKHAMADAIDIGEKADRYIAALLLENQSLGELVRAQQELIELYSAVMDKHTGYLYAHNIRDSKEDINKGGELRDAIAALKNGLGLEG